MRRIVFIRNTQTQTNSPPGDVTLSSVQAAQMKRDFQMNQSNKIVKALNTIKRRAAVKTYKKCGACDDSQMKTS